CHQPREAGSCSENEQRFYFDWGQGRCMNFSYSGCDGNDNNFVREQDCENNCYPFIIPETAWIFRADICSLPADPGPCAGGKVRLRRWYFDAVRGKCRTFKYGGCEGNENKFISQAECEQRC
ncbi:hypothetical protein CAPTEDRAFT_68715, partial [Capitella teleta]